MLEWKCALCACRCGFIMGVVGFSTISKMLLNLCLGRGGRDSIIMFLAQYVIIIINIAICLMISATTSFIFTAQKERMHSVSERAIEKNPKTLCVCFSVLIFFVCLFFYRAPVSQ